MAAPGSTPRTLGDVSSVRRRINWKLLAWIAVVFVAAATVNPTLGLMVLLLVWLSD
jgi:hypothetical protein